MNRSFVLFQVFRDLDSHLLSRQSHFPTFLDRFMGRGLFPTGGPGNGSKRLLLADCSAFAACENLPHSPLLLNWTGDHGSCVARSLAYLGPPSDLHRHGEGPTWRATDCFFPCFRAPAGPPSGAIGECARSPALFGGLGRLGGWKVPGHRGRDARPQRLTGLVAALLCEEGPRAGAMRCGGAACHSKVISRTPAAHPP
jgi:hypothetical protein